MTKQQVTETYGSRQEGLKQAIVLNNGVRMPWLGLGVFQIDDDKQTASCVRAAVERGYRSIDTAAVYGNERGVGAGVRDCGLAREELFVTTKIWNDEMRRRRVEAAFEESLSRLGLDYVDLCLLHWPIKGRIAESWTALEKIHRSGRVRAIGVSNFLPHHLEEVLASGSVVPAVNQIEFHPYLQSGSLVDFCRGKGMAIEAWSPLMQAGSILKDATLDEIGRRHRKSAAQVILRWDIQSGVVTIPKTVKSERMEENADVFDFVLSEEEMAAIDALERGTRIGPDPDNFNF